MFLIYDFIKIGQFNSEVDIHKTVPKISNHIRDLLCFFVLFIRENLDSQKYVESKTTKYFCALSRILLNIYNFSARIDSSILNFIAKLSVPFECKVAKHRDY